MREIKFRAWDGKKMYHIITDVHWLISGEVRFCKWCTSEIDDGVIFEPILTQFTGLYDRNKKEIYEGDIFKAVDDERLNDTWKVEFIDACFKGIREFRYELDLKYWISSQIEIIGNIYEHPELLKVSAP